MRKALLLTILLLLNSFSVSIHPTQTAKAEGVKAQTFVSLAINKTHYITLDRKNYYAILHLKDLPLGSYKLNITAYGSVNRTHKLHIIVKEYWKGIDLVSGENFSYYSSQSPISLTFTTNNSTVIPLEKTCKFLDYFVILQLIEGIKCRVEIYLEGHPAIEVTDGSISIFKENGSFEKFYLFPTEVAVYNFTVETNGSAVVSVSSLDYDYFVWTLDNETRSRLLIPSSEGLLVKVAINYAYNISVNVSLNKVADVLKPQELNINTSSGVPQIFGVKLKAFSMNSLELSVLNDGWQVVADVLSYKGDKILGLSASIVSGHKEETYVARGFTYCWVSDVFQYMVYSINFKWVFLTRYVADGDMWNYGYEITLSQPSFFGEYLYLIIKVTAYNITEVPEEVARAVLKISEWSVEAVKGEEEIRLSPIANLSYGNDFAVFKVEGSPGEILNVTYDADVGLYYYIGPISLFVAASSGDFKSLALPFEGNEIYLVFLFTEPEIVKFRKEEPISSNEIIVSPRKLVSIKIPRGSDYEVRIIPDSPKDTNVLLALLSGDGTPKMLMPWMYTVTINNLETNEYSFTVSGKTANEPLYLIVLNKGVFNITVSVSPTSSVKATESSGTLWGILAGILTGVGVGVALPVLFEIIRRRLR